MEKFIPYNRWKHQHDEYIKCDYPDRPTAEIAEETGLNYYTVSRKAKRMNVGKSDAFMHTSWRKGGVKGHSIKGIQKKSMLTYMQAHFADTKNEELASLFGVDVKTIRRWARQLGLVKSEAFMYRSRSKRKPFYTPEQIAWRSRRIAEVISEAGLEGLQRLADELGIKVKRVQRLAVENGIILPRSNGKYKPGFVAEVAAYFPTHTNKECAEHFGMDTPRISYMAHKYGWKKDESHMRKVYDSNISAANKYRHKKHGNSPFKTKQL